MRRALALSLILQIAWLPVAQGIAAGPTLAWRSIFQHEISFFKLSPWGVLLVGTKRHLFGVNPRSGKRLWRLRNITIQAPDVHWPPTSRLLLVNDDWGGVYRDRETSLMALRALSGEVLWESPLFRGKGLHIVPDVNNHRILLVAVERAHGDDQGFLGSVLPGKGFGSGFKRKAEYYMLDMQTGKLVWQHTGSEKIKLTPAGHDKDFKPRNKEEQSFDLGFYHEPLFLDGKLYISYDGLACLDAATGKLLWRVRYDVTEKDLALTDSEPIVEGNVIYTAGKGKLRAFDRRNGKLLWKSGNYGVVPELYLSADILYGRMGGQFYSPKDRHWKKKGPFGVVAVNRRTGKRLFRFGRADRNITNLLISGTRIFMADADHLIAIDRAVGKRIFKVSHGFGQDPRFIALNERNQLILLGDDSVGFFDSLTGRRLLLKRVKIPGASIWKRLSAIFLVTGGAILSVASFAVALQRDLVPAVPAPLSRVFNTRRELRDITRSSGKGLISSARSLLQADRFSVLDGNHQYYLSRIKGGKNAIVGINLTTGQKDLWVPMEGKQDELLIDDLLRLVYIRKGTQLSAFKFRLGPPPE